VLYLRNGDQVSGTLTALDDKEIRFDSPGKKDGKFERGKIAIIALSTDLARMARPRGPYFRLVLANGSRLALASARTDATTLLGKTLFGAPIQAALDQVSALEMRQGRAVYLSDLKARHYEHTPYLGSRWPYVLDGSVAGYDLRLAGSTYDKGIG